MEIEKDYVDTHGQSGYPESSTRRSPFVRLPTPRGEPAPLLLGGQDYVRLKRTSQREMFVPLTHAPGHAQADFGEAQVEDRRGAGEGTVKLRRGNSKPMENVVSRAYFSRS